MEGHHQEAIVITPKTSPRSEANGGAPIIATHLINHKYENTGDQRREFWFKIKVRLPLRVYRIWDSKNLNEEEKP